MSLSFKEIKEKWKPIDGYEGLYEVSNLGKIKSLPRKYTPKLNILNQIIDSHGYYVVALYRNGKSKRLLVHRLIAVAFIKNPLNKKEVNHKNGIKLDNSLSNLEWVTPKENINHAKINNLLKPNSGKDNGKSKLKESDIKKIRNMYSSGKYTYMEISKKFPVCYNCVGDIIRGKTWKHVK